MKIPLVDCAQLPWWRKFYISDNGHSEFYVIEAALKKYNAHITHNGNIFGELVFDTKEDYVMFVLRWS
jgi:hypothetical protein